VKETILAAIFVIHATAFAYFFFGRRRQIFNLIFFVGFIALAFYYAYHSWLFFSEAQSAPAYLHFFRWAGLTLCAIATPFFVTYLFRKKRVKSLFVTYLSRKKRAKEIQPTDPPETSH
jgi:hypothetical protein